MRNILISDEVWAVIAANGKFPETPNDVLERLLHVKKEVPPPITSPQPLTRQPVAPTPKKPQRHSHSTRRMSAYVQGKILYVKFEHGPEDRWRLPDVSDKNGIRAVRDQAVAFARQNGASLGQENAVKKALTDAGYWLVK